MNTDFRGKSGNYIIELLKHLNMPVITTLHTVLREPNWTNGL